MFYIQQFVEVIELALARSNVSLPVAVGILAVAAGLHLWTQHVHKTSQSPNWTLLQLCNGLSLVIFFASLAQLLQRSGSGFAPSPSDFVWGVLCLFCIVYFFSIFGVWFVHSLLLDDALESEGDDGLENDLGLRDNTLDVNGRRFAILGESIASASTPRTRSRAGTPEDLRSSRHEDGLGGHPRESSNLDGAAAPRSPEEKGGDDEEDAAMVLLREHEAITRDLQAAANRLSKARDASDAWGVLEVLWRATNSGHLSVDLLQLTHVGRCLGNFCKRNCGRCSLPDCEWCEVIAAWKGLAWSEITSRSQQELPHVAPSGLHSSTGASSVSSAASLGRRHRRSSPQAVSRNHSRVALSLEPIPELRERAESSESTSEAEPSTPPRQRRGSASAFQPSTAGGTSGAAAEGWPAVGSDVSTKDEVVQVAATRTAATAATAGASLESQPDCQGQDTGLSGTGRERPREAAASVVSVVSSTSRTCVPLPSSVEKPLSVSATHAAALS